MNAVNYRVNGCFRFAKRTAIPSSLVPLEKWSVVVILALTAATCLVATLAASDGPGPQWEQAPSGFINSSGHVETGAEFALAEPAAKSQSGSDFEERFAAPKPESPRRPSFTERFAAVIDEPQSGPRPSFAERFAASFDRYEDEDEGPASSATTPSPDEPKPADEARPQRSLEPNFKKSTAIAKFASLEAPTKDTELMEEPGGRTAIYDISARTVYLPNGERLEAHSGFGSGLDDPRYIGIRGQGPTPPNVYRLVLRERLFHGVQAIRLVPVDEQKMFGRAGMLAHPYMLGSNGQSNGCVSFQDYPAFLKAFLRGEVDRMIVVEHLEAVPKSSTALGWLPEFIRKFLTPS